MPVAVEATKQLSFTEGAVSASASSARSACRSIRALKAQPGKNILTDGSSQLVHALLEHDLVDELHLLVYPLTVGSGKRVLPNGLHTTFRRTSATPYPTGVVGLHYVRRR